MYTPEHTAHGLNKNQNDSPLLVSEKNIYVVKISVKKMMQGTKYAL